MMPAMGPRRTNCHHKLMRSPSYACAVACATAQSCSVPVAADILSKFPTPSTDSPASVQCLDMTCRKGDNMGTITGHLYNGHTVAQQSDWKCAI